jgi:Holliday junction resolvasome RuvABC endonuclease subunit
MRILALDLSLSGTGWAIWNGTLMYGTLSPKLTSFARLDAIRRMCIEMAEGADLVVMEDLAFSRNMGGTAERHGLAYIIRLALWRPKIPFVLVAPTSLKKFVTGKGNAEKNIVIREVYRRFKDHEGFAVDVKNDNEADSVGLLFIGRALLGDWTPQNQAQIEVLKKVMPEWKMPTRPATEDLLAGLPA